ncbi:hypothetical protein GL50803_00111809 [Giardia duodenalis]|uniref:Uncharacterized protein n=1 Tax=Giardia intestinalis (strain ATCC 50803 / WB clone C6) TaxID=184922 RepID=A8BC45_GIAIC|nr:hypothetical protein GL50803_00111809 [Giardia intestinalis]KAE8301438.1 hypothetical protein GL50803_00111809 [Giardia intestinalis]|eukprot:XP_001707827.1 Hypothetical protein GL50803_111809 [Giardia lamblia ATCC 50803]
MMGSLGAAEHYEKACTAYSQRVNDIVQLLKRLDTLHSDGSAAFDSNNRDRYLTFYRAQDSLLEAMITDISPIEGVPTYLKRLLKSLAELVGALRLLNGCCVRDLEGIFAWIDEHSFEKAQEQRDFFKMQAEAAGRKLEEATALNTSLTKEMEQLVCRYEAQARQKENQASKMLDEYKKLFRDIAGKASRYVKSEEHALLGQEAVSDHELLSTQIQIGSRAIDTLDPGLPINDELLEFTSHTASNLVDLLLRLVEAEGRRHPLSESAEAEMIKYSGPESVRLDALEAQQAALYRQINRQDERLERFDAQNHPVPMSMLDELARDASELKGKSAEQTQHIAELLGIQYESIIPVGYSRERPQSSHNNPSDCLKEIVDSLMFSTACICNLHAVVGYGIDSYAIIDTVKAESDRKRRVSRKRKRMAGTVSARDMISSALDASDLGAKSNVATTQEVPLGDLTPSGQRTYTVRAQLMQL